MVSQNHHQYQEGRCAVCGQPVWSSLKRSLRGLELCPGVPWLRTQELEQYPHLATATTLAARHMKPADKNHPDACYYSSVSLRYIFLFDARQAVPKRALSPRQQAALTEASARMLASRTCTGCGKVKGNKTHLQLMPDGQRLCGLCVVRQHVQEWARSWFAPSAPPWAILDTETTGLTEADEPVEIAVLSPGRQLLFVTRCRPSQPIPPEATAVHGLTDADVADAPSFTEIYPELVAAAAGRCLLGYNVSFDQMILDAACRRHQVPPLRSRGVQWVDVMQPYADWAGDWNERRGEYRWQPLPHLSPATEAHTALGDCQAVLDLLHFLADQPAVGDHRSENVDAGNARQKAEAYRG